MHRQKLISQLESYHPADSQEQEYKRTILTFVHAQPNCFERTLAIGHITASAWLLDKSGTHALLMHHTKLDKWFQLGGHCDGDPDVLAVAIKEAQEESGINGISSFAYPGLPAWQAMADKPALSPAIFDIDVHLIPENPRDKAHYHYDIRFLLQVTSDEQVVQNSESKELRWISKDLAKLPTNERSVTRMFEKWVNRA